MREELDELVRQKGALEKRLNELYQEKLGLWNRRNDLQARIDGLIVQVKPTEVIPTKGSKVLMTRVQSKIVEKIEEAVRKDTSGLFTSEMERLLNL